jgi:hypothetical protein
MKHLYDLAYTDNQIQCILISIAIVFGNGRPVPLVLFEGPVNVATIQSISIF